MPPFAAVRTESCANHDVAQICSIFKSLAGSRLTIQAFVAYPPDMETITEFKNSHMNGQCVDVTLTDMDGNDILMPSAFDDFTEKARLDCQTTSGEALKNATHRRCCL